MAHNAMEWRNVPAGPTASVIVAGLLEAHVRRALAADGDALLALAGGRTPGEAYQRLAASAIDWRRVTIVPSDERWVELGHPDSNELMLRHCFARAARVGPAFISLRGHATAIDVAVAEAQSALSARPGPFALTLLGVGADGHIASLFPGAAELETAIADDAGGSVYVVHPTPAAPPPAVPRLTLGLRRLLHTRQLVLLFGGAQKRGVVESAMRAPDPLRWPVSALFRPGLPPLQLIYLEDPRSNA